MPLKIPARQRKYMQMYWYTMEMNLSIHVYAYFICFDIEYLQDKQNKLVIYHYHNVGRHFEQNPTG